MANIKSAIKRINTNNKKRERNKALKSKMRTEIKKVEKLIETNNLEEAKVAFQAATKAIDKAVQKGAIHKNNGNRQKSRLAAKLNKVSA